MRILSSSRIREWDEYTIRHEPVSSLDLMERAASALEQWILNSTWQQSSFVIFCGKGNNGGDGLALARLLSHQGKKVTVYIAEHGRMGTADFQANLTRLHDTPAQIIFLSSPDPIHPFSETDLIIDALLGMGLNRAAEGLEKELIDHINSSGRPVISVDIPSGMYADRTSRGNTIVKATCTLSFECYKLALMVPENAEFMGTVEVLPIGLSPDFPKLFAPDYRILTRAQIQNIWKPRTAFGHKGSFGHAAIIAGQKGMMGAAVLAVKACLRSGTGKVTGIIPDAGLNILQTSVPEALTVCNGKEKWEILPELFRYQAIGVGPAIGTGIEQDQLLQQMLHSFKGKLVVDADGLTLLATTKQETKGLLSGAVLTPHPGEWERLCPSVTDDFERLVKVQEFAREHDCVVVLKGHRTFITNGKGENWFNLTGNNGLAKAGTGDVLTGMITAFLAQGYSTMEAAQSGVFIHGEAASYITRNYSTASVLASDIIEAIGHVMPE